MGLSLNFLSVFPRPHRGNYGNKGAGDGRSDDNEGIGRNGGDDDDDDSNGDSNDDVDSNNDHSNDFG